MLRWDNRERQYHAPFDIIIQTIPEEVRIRDMFDDSINPDTGKSYYDVDYMEQQVENGSAEWSVVNVQCMLNGVELGSFAIGGAYLDEHYDLMSFVYDNGMIDEAKNDAKIWLDNTKEVVYA
tara:strand:- start:172 stop:537 length:366 start_codon:yes stop_codon:yes gene_type:complete